MSTYKVSFMRVLTFVAVLTLVFQVSFSVNAGVAIGADAFYARTLWKGDGTVIDDAVIIVADGKITDVGARSDVEVPAGAIEHELGDVSLVPGLVLAETTLAERGRDEEESVTPYIQAIDGFDYFGEYDRLLSVGITTVQLSPGSERIMPGQGAVVKLAGEDPTKQTLSAAESLRILLTQQAFNPPRIYEPPVGAVSVERPLEPTRPQLAGNLADAIAGVRALLIASSGPEAKSDLILETLSEAISSGMPVRITAKSAGEIAAAMQLADSFQLPTILVDADQLTSLDSALSLQADWVRGLVLRTDGRATSLSAVPIPNDDSPETLEPWQRVAYVAEKKALDRLAITASDGDLEEIWFLAATMLAADIEPAQLLSCLTGNAAKVLGVEERVGTLSAGKDADFVILSGNPFAPKTQVLATYVDGQKVYDRRSAERVRVITADRIYSNGQAIDNGTITIEGSKVRMVGEDVSYPLDAELISFPDCVIVPGFVDMATQVGTGSSFGDRVNLNDKIGELLATDDEQIKLARQGGVTTGLLSSSNLPSPVVAFKLGDVPRVLQDPVAIRFKVSGNLTSEEAKLKTLLETAKKYVDSWNEYDAAYAKYKKELAEYEAAKAKYDAVVEAKKKQEEEAKKKAEEAAKAGQSSNDSDKPKSEGEKSEDKPKEESKDSAKESEAKPAGESKDGEKTDGKDKANSELVEPKKPEEPKKPRETAALEPYRTLFAGKISAIVEVEDAKALEISVKLFVDEYKLPTVLDASGSSYREAGELAGKKLSVVVHPPLLTTDNGEIINLPERFLTAGLTTAIETQSGTGTKRLPSLMAYTVHRGLGRDDALACLTTTPSKLMGLKSVGTLAPNMDADLVVMTGLPFDAASRIVAVMIDGVWVYQDEDLLRSQRNQND